MRSDSIENKQTILASFESLLASEDFATLTMTEDVRASGLGRGTVYRHFSDIGSLMFEKFSVAYHDLYSSFEPEHNEWSDVTLRKELDNFLNRVFLFSHRHRKFFLIEAFSHAHGHKLAQTELRRKISLSITQLCKRELDKKELRRWADVIARCVEVEHIHTAKLGVKDAQFSVHMATTILKGID